MRSALLVAAAIAALTPASAAAQDNPTIAAARAAGQVGERFDGYLGLAGNAPAAVRAQVNAVNIKRRALYSNLAARRQVAPEDVGLTAGCELLGTVAVGEAYLLGDNRWRRRAQGEGTPVPDYCRP